MLIGLFYTLRLTYKLKYSVHSTVFIHTMLCIPKDQKK